MYAVCDDVTGDTSDMTERTVLCESGIRSSSSQLNYQQAINVIGSDTSALETYSLSRRIGAVCSKTEVVS